MEQIDPSLTDELLVPYSEAELKRHRIDRIWKSAFEQVHAQNFRLIAGALDFIDFLDGETPPPKTHLGALLYPGNDIRANASECLLDGIRQLMIETPRSQIPLTKIACFSSRSTASLLMLLEKIRPSGPLLEARRSITHIYRHIFGLENPLLRESAYEREINEHFDSFIESCRLNATEVATFEEEMRATRRPIKVRKRSAANRFTHAQRLIAESVWERGLEDPSVINGAAHPRISCEDVYRVYWKVLKRAGIDSVDAFRRCRESVRNQRNYDSRRKP